MSATVMASRPAFRRVLRAGPWELFIGEHSSGRRVGNEVDSGDMTVLAMSTQEASSLCLYQSLGESGRIRRRNDTRRHHGYTSCDIRSCSIVQTRESVFRCRRCQAAGRKVAAMRRRWRTSKMQFASIWQLWMTSSKAALL
jgi:hypothetical protein